MAIVRLDYGIHNKMESQEENIKKESREYIQNGRFKKSEFGRV